MGRKKKDTDYMSETCSWNIRIPRDVVKEFLETFHRERIRRKATGQRGYFINRVITDLLNQYIQEAKENESIQESESIK